MPLRLAFAGFRHGHILELYDRARQGGAVEVVAACEEHAETRAQLASAGRVAFTHDRVDRILDEVEFDALAVGDYFGRRGELVIEALSRGRHVIADKPLCTRMSEVLKIEQLARETGRRIGCMLTMRDSGQLLAVRTLIASGAIGEIHAIAFSGQHPLMPESRPAWYFEPGKHGGTITDIGIHAVDALPWVTGLEWRTLNAARSWNAFVPEYPHFEDAAQMMLTMENGGGVLGDVSYHAPDRMGYRMPQYWRLTFWGREGLAEVAVPSAELLLIGRHDQEVRRQPLPPDRPAGYLEDFLEDVAGRRPESGLDTEAVLRSTRTAIRIQEAANQGEREVLLTG